MQAAWHNRKMAVNDGGSASVMKVMGHDTYLVLSGSNKEGQLFGYRQVSWSVAGTVVQSINQSLTAFDPLQPVLSRRPRTMPGAYTFLPWDIDILPL